MGLILIFVVGFIVLMVAILSIFGVVSDRASGPTNELKKEMNDLEKRINELENDKKNNA